MAAGSRSIGKQRLLLITPENREVRRFRRWQFNNFIQLTMPYLAGFVDERSFEISLVDEFHQTIPFNARYDLVAITVNTPNASHCYSLAERFRRQGAWVVLGGPHVTLLPEEAIGKADTVMVGEAEETWPRFLADFLNHRAVPRYQAVQAPSLRGLPQARRDLVRGRWFTRGAVFATRGCPFACRYCNLKQIYHPTFRTRPIEEVVSEIKAMPERQFVFWDDNLFGEPEYARQLLTELRPLKRRWAAQVSMDRCRDQQLLMLARESGCQYLFLGLESFSDQSLAGVDKAANRVEDYREVVGSIHRHGISVQAGVIFGFDQDGPEVFRETLQACESLGIDGVTPSVLTPFPRTPLFEKWSHAGRLAHTDWRWYNGKTRVAFTPNRMTADELFRGYTWFREQVFSLRSIVKRLRVSRTNVLPNLLLNLGYKWSL